MKSFILSTTAAALLASSAPSFAQEVGSSRLSFGASSIGVTGEYSYRFQSNLSVRGVVGGAASVSRDVFISGETYAVKASPQSAGLMLDYHTGLGGLRVSGGAFYNGGSLTGTTSFTGTFTYGGQTFTGTDTVTATIKPKNEFAPALSVGYDQPIGDGFVISAEAGGIFNGGYTASATSTPGGAIETAPGGAATLASEVTQIQNKVDDTLRFYPYVSVMVGIRF